MATKKKAAKKKTATKKPAKRKKQAIVRRPATQATTTMPVTDLDGNKLGEVTLTKELWEKLKAKSLVPAVQVTAHTTPEDDKQPNLFEESKNGEEKNS